MNTFLQILILICLCLGIVVLCAQFLWPLIVTYMVTERAIEIRVMKKMRIMRIAFDEIADIHTIPYRDMLPWLNPKSVGWMRLGNRLCATGVLINRKGGIARSIVISPDKSNEFVENIRSKLSQANSTRQS